MNNKEPDYDYILTRSTSGFPLTRLPVAFRLHTCKNPSFREDGVKIGKSSRPVDVRSKKWSEEFGESYYLSLFYGKVLLLEKNH